MITVLKYLGAAPFSLIFDRDVKPPVKPLISALRGVVLTEAQFMLTHEHYEYIEKW